MTSNAMHFLKPEGALIHYPCACVHFFCTRAERNRCRSRIVAAPNCVPKLIVAAASIRSCTVGPRYGVMLYIFYFPYYMHQLLPPVVVNQYTIVCVAMLFKWYVYISPGGGKEGMIRAL